jgi:hypothetical protein
VFQAIVKHSRYLPTKVAAYFLKKKKLAAKVKGTYLCRKKGQKVLSFGKDLG